MWAPEAVRAFCSDHPVPMVQAVTISTAAAPVMHVQIARIVLTGTLHLSCLKNFRRRRRHERSPLQHQTVDEADEDQDQQNEADGYQCEALFWSRRSLAVMAHPPSIFAVAPFPPVACIRACGRATRRATRLVLLPRLLRFRPRKSCKWRNPHIPK